MSSPDLFVPAHPLPKGSGSRRLLPANCPLCYKRIPSRYRIGKLGPFVEQADVGTQTRPAHALKHYCEAIAREAARAYGVVVDGPIEVRLQFRFERPKSVKREHPTAEYDIDKLTRAVLDALTGIAFTNDARVVKLIASKVYAPKPGVAVRVRSLTGQGVLA